MNIFLCVNQKKSTKRKQPYPPQVWFVLRHNFLLPRLGNKQHEKVSDMVLFRKALGLLSQRCMCFDVRRAYQLENNRKKEKLYFD